MNLKELYLSDNYLLEYRDVLKRYEDIILFKENISNSLTREYLKKYTKYLEQLSHIKAKYVDLLGDVIQIGKSDEISFQEYTILEKQLKSMIPWRKGPFNYFGHYVDSEWRSDFKWNRILPKIKDNLKDAIVGDIGCNNSYYMYKMLPYNPKLVIGFDPMEKYFINYYLNNMFLKDSRIKFEIMGVEQVDMFGGFFDVLFVLGVIYHRRDPITMLQKVNSALKDDGIVIIESAGIPGDESIMLFPEDRYLKAKGYWFLPTVKALESMLKRTNFYEIETFVVTKLAPNEQRNTPWVQTQSLEEFLDKDNPDLTVEGYPAPIRIYTKARKKYNKQIHKY